MADSRIKVRIYGQDYTIIGDRPEEEIREVAAYINERMNYIAQNSNIGSTSSLAVLSSVNIADELFQARLNLVELEKRNKQLEHDNKKFADLWDDAKKNVIAYRNEIEALKVKAADNSKLKALEEKYKELEANFFDLQMENIKLKSQAEKFSR